MYIVSKLIYSNLGITNPKQADSSKDAVKSFNFDHSYWTHDVSFTMEVEDNGGKSSSL